MTFTDWVAQAENYVFLAIAIPMLFSAWRVVASQNVVHSVLYLVGALAGSAALFLLLGSEFVAWTVVLVYIGAVVVLFLFGIMITRAPLGQDVELSQPLRQRLPAAVVSGSLFLLMTGAMFDAFGGDVIPETEATRTFDVGISIFERWVIPFEVVSVILLAALVGGIVLARRDPDEMTEEVVSESEEVPQ
ncbi:MAG: NADH-quinone oxidoreductase subunit J [Acidimicrobiia bacterium]|nr:NADH-quinone oxidoreductase subunit J [Acidimicrobiia bacterium]